MRKRKIIEEEIEENTPGITAQTCGFLNQKIMLELFLDIREELIKLNKELMEKNK